MIRQDLEVISRVKLAGDIVLANFEGVLSAEEREGEWIFTMPFGAADILKSMGINALSTANNHALDLGIEGYRKTVKYLKQRGFGVAGYYGRGTVFKIGDISVRVIAFSFESPNNVNEPDKIKTIIGRCPEDIVIVSAHMGGENKDASHIPGGMEYFGEQKRGDVVRFSRCCIDAGADLVLGHGPHMIRRAELYKGKLIMYSLGNFIFDHPGIHRIRFLPMISAAVKLDRRGDFLEARITSYKHEGGRFAVDGRGTGFNMLRDLSLAENTNNGLTFIHNKIVRRK
jgi:hypothetical protein